VATAKISAKVSVLALAHQANVCYISNHAEIPVTRRHEHGIGRGLKSVYGQRDHYRAENFDAFLFTAATVSNVTTFHSGSRICTSCLSGTTDVNFWYIFQRRPIANSTSAASSAMLDDSGVNRGLVWEV